MSDGPAATTLRRIARAAAPPAPLTPARALRLALTRAAERSIALPLTVLGIQEEEGPLDDLLAQLEGVLMPLALRRGGAPVGLIALDSEARGAAIEVQALGQVSSAPSDPREPTAADVALARPLVDAFRSEAEEALEGTPFADWLGGSEVAERFPSAREAAMLLPDGGYRAMRVTLDLGAGGRQGILLLLARLPEPPRQANPDEEAPDATVEAEALRAQAPVEAILHRLQLPLEEAEALEVGQLLPLPGVTVASVRLLAGGVPLGPARLGQVAGMRAVRIETPLAPELADLPPLSGPATGGPLLAESSWTTNEKAPDLGPPDITPTD